MSRLLTIELDNITSVPRVFYKGDEVKDKVRVKFDWETNKSEVEATLPDILIEYLNDCKNVGITTIEHGNQDRLMEYKHGRDRKRKSATQSDMDKF
ncbi:hypothetical protein [Aquibacillus kalidii]|uniref:hypothetical protein n=1 Tax=Aquibacillus kalidii TaxID=2762597 RepID=UPI00164624B9|nr:hypothetical protein [Aquibacillus kalidii]